MSPRTAVITITRDRDEHLHRQRRGLALAGARVAARSSPVEHIVVGMGESPRLRPVQGAMPTVALRHPDSPRGLPLASARNLGARVALRRSAELLIFLDVDCIPGADLVCRYRDAALTLGRRRALLCGPVAYLPPPVDGDYPLIDTDGLAGLAAPHPARPAPTLGELRFDDRFELFWSLSFAVAARTWTDLGGFHPGYAGYGAEDTDFAVRAATAGATLVWVGGALAHHQYHPPSRGCSARQREMVCNANLFHDRHGYFPMAGWLAELAAQGVVEFAPERGLLRLPGSGPSHHQEVT